MFCTTHPLEAFWKTFAELCDPQAAETVAKLQEKNSRIVLATNPLFPQIVPISAYPNGSFTELLNYIEQ